MFLTILAEFFAAYFACVYYRWSVGFHSLCDKYAYLLLLSLTIIRMSAKAVTCLRQVS